MPLEDALQVIITDAAESNDVQIRTNYSGRGMYGRKCLGVEGSREDIQNFLKEVTYNCHAQEMEDEDFPPVFDDWMEMCFSYDQDSMGLDIIIYWPDVEVN